MIFALVIIFSLFAALSWGLGDFSGGIASKKSNVIIVLIVSQLTGVIFLILTAFSTGETFSLNQGIWPIFAGLSGVLGLISLYRGLAVCKMSFVAPVTAVIATSFPVIYTFISEGVPNNLQLFGILFAIISIWLISYAQSNDRQYDNNRRLSYAYAFFAGINFGFFFISIGKFNSGNVYWPLVLLRLTSITILLLILSFLIIFSQKYEAEVNFKIINFRFIVLAGLSDTLGNIFFTLSTQKGRLDIATSISSLYPLYTVILARIFYKELIKPHQWLGIIIAIFAVILMTL